MKKMIITDLDGTFVFNSKYVEKKDLLALKKLQEKYIICVATGRSIKEINYIEQENNINFEYKIGFNGAVITDKSNEIIFSKYINKEKLINLFNYIKENKLIFDALDGKNRIGNFFHENQETLWNMNITCNDNPYQLLKNKKIFKINIRPDKKNSINIYNNLLKEFNNISIIKTSSTRIEICEKNISKGIAIKKIKGNYFTIGIGDSENDISMFENVDKSICISHASDNVKIKADVIIDKFSDILKIID